MRRCALLCSVLAACSVAKESDLGDAGGRGDAGVAAADAGEASADAGEASADAGGSADAGPALDAGPVSTAGVRCDHAYSGFNASTSVQATSMVSWTCTDRARLLTANGLPEHEVGTFPNRSCPNTIAAYSVSATLTLEPALTGATTAARVVGWALNGVKLDPNTAGGCDSAGNCSLIGNSGSWSIEALGQSSFDFGVDDSNAHVQPTGEYHYHGMPEGELARLSGGAARMTLVGFANDGFPIYARYGLDAPLDAGSSVRPMRGSYRTKAQPGADRPPVTTYPMGTFLQDWEYVAGLGDLDECNGRFGVTPEFPRGIYHYYITDTYPFIQRCVKGTATGGGGMGGGMGAPDGGMGGGTGGGPPPCAPGQTSRCCGDGRCDGPETAANCPADCP